jgi:hypothetical protein
MALSNNAKYGMFSIIVLISTAMIILPGVGLGIQRVCYNAAAIASVFDSEFYKHINVCQHYYLFKHNDNYVRGDFYTNGTCMHKYAFVKVYYNTQQPNKNSVINTQQCLPSWMTPLCITSIVISGCVIVALSIQVAKDFRDLIRAHAPENNALLGHQNIQV